MDDGPFAVVRAAAYFYADGFHDAFAGAVAVAWAIVDVPAVQARGAVVAMFGSPGLAGDLEFAVDTRKAIRFVSALVFRM